jgi:glycosyltransferase involved in cell wall biosynthesis
MENVKLSAIIVTRNEEKNIERCLSSIKWLDEIVIVDQSSSDDTVNICRRYTDKVFVVPNKGFCEPDRALAASKSSNDWLLYMDADEVVSDALKKEIEELLAKGPAYASYYIPRKNIFLGRWIRGSGWYPGYVLRLFRKESVKFLDDIHTNPVPLAGYGYLKEHIIHYTCENLNEYITKIGRYSSVAAAQAFAGGARVNVWNFPVKILVLPIIYFTHRFILKMGLRDGVQGFLIASLTARNIFITNVKLWKICRRSSGKNGRG